jgi:hypothetical protein
MRHGNEEVQLGVTTGPKRDADAGARRDEEPVPRYCGAWCRAQAQRAPTRERARSAPDKTEA